MLAAVAGGVAFRHELARLAVDESLPPNAKLAFTRKHWRRSLADPRALRMVLGSPTMPRRRCDRQAVLRFSPGRPACIFGWGPIARPPRSMRGHCGSATASRPRRGGALRRRARERGAVGQFTDAIAAYRQALECHRQVGDARKEGDSLRALGRPLWVLSAEGTRRRMPPGVQWLSSRRCPGGELARAYCALSTFL